jgi:starch synthase (maltosyl-transferring)
VYIERVTPSVNCGRAAAKAVIEDRVVIGADVLREGHELLAAVVQYRRPSHTHWLETPLTLEENDRWYGSFTVSEIGGWQFRILAWTDHYASWLDGIQKRHRAGQTDLDVDFLDGARLLERRGAPAEALSVFQSAAAFLRSDTPQVARVARAGDPVLLRTLDVHPERLDPTYSQELPLWVDRTKAQFTAWYEFFPRSEGATATISGTLVSAAKRLSAIAEMGFDIVYLPPIHPIGRTHRKGRNNALIAYPSDPGVPWAIGSPEGGHTAVHPDLGTIDDFDEFVAEAARCDLEVALDLAFQCSPDHPWVWQHPDWFKRRADGTVQYAQNPPKLYQDIYPIDFDTPDLDNLYDELKRVVEFWISHGVRFFRVDNPHTKPLPFWEWLIAQIHRERPDVLFLAEAFTRPKMMAALAKIGFSQNYTYFAWRNTKLELTEYVSELAHTDTVDFFRPTFWTNTPDILTEYLQLGGPPAFRVRLVLAALLCPAYGVYSGFELYENVPVRPGSEEYMNSEKYQYKPRDWSDPGSLAPFIARINWIRRKHRAFHTLRNIWFHEIKNDQLLCFSKVETGRTNPVLVVVNLDPHNPQAATTWLDMWQLGMEHVGPFEAHDLLTDTTYIWHGPENYVQLDPSASPAHVLRLRPL